MPQKIFFSLDAEAQCRKFWYWTSTDEKLRDLENWLQSEFQPAETQKLFRLLRQMATVKGPRLHPSSEKYEHESGKIFAIKSFQIRLYGVLSPLDDFTILHFAKKKRTRLSGNDKGIIEVNYERWRQEHAE